MTQLSINIIAVFGDQENVSVQTTEKVVHGKRRQQMHMRFAYVKMGVRHVPLVRARMHLSFRPCLGHSDTQVSYNYLASMEN